MYHAKNWSKVDPRASLEIMKLWRLQIREPVCLHCRPGELSFCACTTSLICKIWTLSRKQEKQIFFHKRHYLPAQERILSLFFLLVLVNGCLSGKTCWAEGQLPSKLLPRIITLYNELKQSLRIQTLSGETLEDVTGKIYIEYMYVTFNRFIE